MGKKSRRNRPGPAQNTTAITGLTQSQQHRSIVEERHRRHRERGDPVATLLNLKREFLTRNLIDANPWNQERMETFFFLTQTLMDKSCFDRFRSDYEIIQEFLMFFKPFRRNKEEPAFYRAVAYECTVWLKQLSGFDPYGDTLQYYDKALELFDSVSDEESNKIVVLGSQPVPFASYYQFRRANLYNVFKKAIDTFNFGGWSVNGTDLSISLFAGLMCDRCGKQREETGLGQLHQCGNCRTTYYCSVQCQQEAWNLDGHKRVCRKKGSFKVGDMAVLTKTTGTISSGSQVELLAPAKVQDGDVENTKKPSHWVVKEYRKSGTVVVATRTLKNMRSSVWYQWNTQDLQNITRHLVLANLNRQNNPHEVEEEEEEEEMPPLVDKNFEKESAKDDNEKF